MRRLPSTLPADGLLVGWSLEPGRRRRHIGFTPPDPQTSSPATTLEPILDTGEGHLITIAPTGAGKGTGCIIPALLRYPGPVAVIDPKGENYAVTARRRRAMGQEVVVLDPFGITAADERHRFNPLDLADPRSDRLIEDVATLATLASSNAGSTAMDRDPFWPQMGRTLVAAAILDVLTMPDSKTATMPAVRAVINQPLDKLAKRAEQWQRADHPELRRMAGLLVNPAEATLGGYWALAVNQLDFLKGGQMEAHLSASDLDLNKVYDGSPLSVYLVLPPDKLQSHSALLRLWIGALVSVITRRSQRPQHATLMLVDEAAQLGELPQLRQAVTLLRGYGVRVWSFWQDISQIQHLYPADWETLLNNCRIQQYFGATTALSADAVVAASGFGPREAILDLERDEMILNVAGDEPVVVRKPNYRFDPPFQGLYDGNPFYAAHTDSDDQVQTRAVFRRTEAPAARHKAQSAREAMILGRKVFHPVPGRRWEVLDGEAREQCFDHAGITSGTFRADPRIVVRRCELPFYTGFDWYEIEDTCHSPSRHAYYLIGPDKGYRLDGNAGPIHGVNRSPGLVLDQTNAAFYLEFFCASVHGADGRFLILDSADEIEWREAPEGSFMADLRGRVSPPRFTAAPEGRPGSAGAWYMQAELMYADALFTARFQVEPTLGEVEMLEDTPLATDLPVVLDRDRLAYIGYFDEDGNFHACHEPE